MPDTPPTGPLPLKEACLRAAREAIAEQGVEQLSLREVARRLGVSHQAPYRHFPSRDHLLAEVMRRCFQEPSGKGSVLRRRSPLPKPSCCRGFKRWGQGDLNPHSLATCGF